MAPGDWSVFAWHAANLPTMPEAEDIGNEAAGGRFGVSIRSAGYLRKWFLLGITIGVIAGLGAFEKAWPLLWFVVIGLIAAAVGYLYARVFHASVAITRRLPGGPVLKPAIGGLLVGLLGLPIPQILSSGYGWAQLAADRGTLLSIPLWIVIVLPIAKILATSLSIGTGGSGGLFGPGIVIGAFVGAAIWRLGELTELPGVPHEPGIFVVVAMMACFGSVSRAPLAVMIMVAEMTGSFSVVPGAIIAVGIAALLLSRTNVTIYETQRLNRQTAEAERGGSDRPTTA